MSTARLGGPSGGVALAIAAAAVGCFRLGFDAPPETEADPAACANFADDDGDGLTDCADPDCAGPCGACQGAICVAGFARSIEGSQLVQVCDASGTLFCPVGSCAADQVCAGAICVAPQCGPDWQVATPALAGGAHRLTAVGMGSFGGWLLGDGWTSAAAHPLANGW